MDVALLCCCELGRCFTVVIVLLECRLHSCLTSNLYMALYTVQITTPVIPSLLQNIGSVLTGSGLVLLSNGCTFTVVNVSFP